MNSWLIPALLTASASPAAAQQLIAWQGQEYVDTTTVRPADCPAPFGARYYQVQGKYPRSSATLAAGAQQWLRQQDGSFAGSGYVTFRFVVDCRGRRLPRTQVLQATSAYQPTHFAPALVAALYGYLQTLTEWKVAKAPRPLSYIAYLTFKLDNGHVAAVLP